MMCRGKGEFWGCVGVGEKEDVSLTTLFFFFTEFIVSHLWLFHKNPVIGGTAY